MTQLNQHTTQTLYKKAEEFSRIFASTITRGSKKEFQETLFSELLLYIAKQNKPIDHALLYSVARNISARMKYNHAHGLDYHDSPWKANAEGMRAYKIYIQKTKEETINKGRPLTRSEEDNIAITIITTWKDPRHKPPANFHRPTKTESIYSPSTTNDNDTYNILDRTPTKQADQEGRTHLYEHIDNQFPHKPSKKQMLKTMFDTILPGLLKANYSTKKDSHLRRTMKNSGMNIKNIIDAYNNGDTNPTIDLFFMPFSGATTHEDKSLVIEWFEENPAIADQAWDLAVSAAHC